MTTVSTSTLENAAPSTASTSRVATAARVEEPEELLAMLCAAADETKAQDITILDVRGQTILADFFVLCTGTSSTHVQAIARNVSDRLRMDARRRAKPEGDSESLWIVMDYSDVILSVFDAPTREFYDLERLWGDAKISRYTSQQSPNPAATAAAQARDEQSARDAIEPQE